MSYRTQNTLTTLKKYGDQNFLNNNNISSIQNSSYALDRPIITDFSKYLQENVSFHEKKSISKFIELDGMVSPHIIEPITSGLISQKNMLFIPGGNKKKLLRTLTFGKSKGGDSASKSNQVSGGPNGRLFKGRQSVRTNTSKMTRAMIKQNKINHNNQNSDYNEESDGENSYNNKGLSLKKEFYGRPEIRYYQNDDDINKKRKRANQLYSLLFDPKLFVYNNNWDISDDDDDNDDRISKSEKKIRRFRKKRIFRKRSIMEKMKLQLEQLKKKNIHKKLSHHTYFRPQMMSNKYCYIIKTKEIIGKLKKINEGSLDDVINCIKDCNFSLFREYFYSEKLDPNTTDRDGNCLLTLAVKSSSYEICNFLLEEKADPDYANVRFFYFIY